MNAALKIAAQSVMDSYFQDYAAGDSFFRIEDFAFWLGKAHGKYADEVAKEKYGLTRSESGTGAITFSSEWWAKKVYEVKVDKDGIISADIDFKTVDFTYDSQESGIQEVQPTTAGSCNYVRTTLTELWMLKNLSKSNIAWWYRDDCKIKFLVNSMCQPKSIAVYYIASAEDEGFKLPPSKAFEIATLAFNYMTAAKKETQFVDMTNNQNKNVIPQIETDAKPAKPVGQ